MISKGTTGELSHSGVAGNTSNWKATKRKFAFFLPSLRALSAEDWHASDEKTENLALIF